MASDDEAVDVAAQARTAATAGGSDVVTLLQTRSTPIPLKFTVSRRIQSKIGVRKDITALGLVRFRAKADILLPSGRFVYGFSARDTLLNGRFSVNIPAKVAAYSKELPLPNGMWVSVTAGLQHVGGGGGAIGNAVNGALGNNIFGRNFKPICGFQLRSSPMAGAGGNMVYSGDGFSVKQRVPLPLGLLGLEYPRFDLETFTSVRIPQLTSRFSVFGMQAPPRGVGGGIGGGGLSFGNALGALGQAMQQEPEDDAFTVHMQGVNAVIRL